MNSQNVYSKVWRVRLVSYISNISWKCNSVELCMYLLIRMLFLALIFPIVGSGIVAHIASSYSKSVCEVPRKPNASYVIIGHKTLCLLLWRGRVGGDKLTEEKMKDSKWFLHSSHARRAPRHGCDACTRSMTCMLHATSFHAKMSPLVRNLRPGGPLLMEDVS